jgi:hypothetical protein
VSMLRNFRISESLKNVFISLHMIMSTRVMVF